VIAVSLDVHPLASHPASDLSVMSLTTMSATACWAMSDRAMAVAIVATPMPLAWVRPSAVPAMLAGFVYSRARVWSSEQLRWCWRAPTPHRLKVERPG